eukprot:8213098-Pyramimonas_sp.AAC.1
MLSSLKSPNNFPVDADVPGTSMVTTNKPVGPAHSTRLIDDISLNSPRVGDLNASTPLELRAISFFATNPRIGSREVIQVLSWQINMGCARCSPRTYEFRYLSLSRRPLHQPFRSSCEGESPQKEKFLEACSGTQTVSSRIVTRGSFRIFAKHSLIERSNANISPSIIAELALHAPPSTGQPRKPCLSVCALVGALIQALLRYSVLCSPHREHTE